MNQALCKPASSERKHKFQNVNHARFTVLGQCSDRLHLRRVLCFISVRALDLVGEILARTPVGCAVTIVVDKFGRASPLLVEFLYTVPI